MLGIPYRHHRTEQLFGHQARPTITMSTTATASTKFLKLKTSDSEIVRVDLDVFTSVSDVVKEMVELECESKERKDAVVGGGGDSSIDDEAPIHLTNVTKQTLDLIIGWAKEHQHDERERPAPVPPNRRPEDMTDWDKAFVHKLDRPALFDLMLAANFLDIKGLIQLCVKKTLLMIRGKSVEETREILGIEDDMTPEQKKLIRKENDWVEYDGPRPTHTELSNLENDNCQSEKKRAR